MKNYTKKEIIEIAKKEEVKYIKLQFTDMLGTIKSVEIPAVRKKATRTEIRNVDPAANPYLAFACILDAGLKGIAEEYPDVEPVYDNIFEYTREEREQHGIKNLPENLKDAVKELKQSQFMKEALGEHIFNKYIIAKELEWDEYRVLVTDWEIKKYL